MISLLVFPLSLFYLSFLFEFHSSIRSHTYNKISLINVMFSNDNGHKRTDYIPIFPLALLPLTVRDVDFTIPPPFFRSPLTFPEFCIIVGVIGVTVFYWAHRYMNFENFIVISALNLLTKCHHVNFKTLPNSFDLAYKENMSFWLISLRTLLRWQYMGGTLFWILECWKSLCFFCNIWALWWKK